jgi:8-oxo-dGTP pyrophosphatase MutT (NUDIX family)
MHFFKGASCGLHKEEHMVARASLIVLGVFRHEERFLVVQERDGSWYLPAGRVEDGENLVAAVVRETIEEAGQLCGISGLVGFDHSWHGEGSGKLRFVFTGYRGLVMPPKSRPDHHSRGAAWLTREEIGALPLRHPEVLSWIDKVLEGAPLLPTGAYDWLGPPPLQERRAPSRS